jgi:hypothetical protein
MSEHGAAMSSLWIALVDEKTLVGVIDGLPV